jgi:YD repeat-containing protein
LNQLSEIDTSAQSLGYPVPAPTPGAANVFFSRYNFSGTANNGQVASVDDARQSGANIVYTYDALKRLTNATTAAWTQTTGYDGFGNITSKSVPSGSAEPTFPGAVSSKNWLAGVSYDLNGNALAVNAFALTYDVENRLATATSGTAVESYFYDESNHRVEKILGSADYLYFYGPGGRLLSIRSVSGTVTNVVADRMYFGGMLLGSAGPEAANDVSTMTDRLGTAATGYPYGTDKGTPPGNDQPDFATTRDMEGLRWEIQMVEARGLPTRQAGTGMHMRTMILLGDLTQQDLKTLGAAPMIWQTTCLRVRAIPLTTRPSSASLGSAQTNLPQA